MIPLLISRSATSGQTETAMFAPAALLAGAAAAGAAGLVAAAGLGASVGLGAGAGCSPRTGRCAGKRRARPVGGPVRGGAESVRSSRSSTGGRPGATPSAPIVHHTDGTAGAVPDRVGAARALHQPAAGLGQRSVE